MTAAINRWIKKSHPQRRHFARIRPGGLSCPRRRRSNVQCKLSRFKIALVCSISCWTLTAVAAPKGESVLPGTTKGYIAITNVKTLEESFNKTQLGQLCNDPLMKPFADDLKRQLQEKWSATHHRLGL